MTLCHPPEKGKSGRCQTISNIIKFPTPAKWDFRARAAFERDLDKYGPTITREKHRRRSS